MTSPLPKRCTQASWTWMAGCVLVLHGCLPPADSTLYMQALSMASPEDLTPCAEITSPTLQGDCQLALAERMPYLADWCDQIAAEPWKSECWFEASEGARDARRWADAVAMCDSATVFENACLNHLWQPQLQHILQAHPGQDFQPSLAAVHTLHNSWLALIGDRLTEPLWFNYARSVFRGAPQAPATWCTQLPDAHQDLCRNVHQQVRSEPSPQPPRPRRPRP